MVMSGARCRLAYGPADATVSCFSKIQIGFTFLVPAHPGSIGQRAVNGCVCALEWDERFLSLIGAVSFCLNVVWDFTNCLIHCLFKQIL